MALDTTIGGASANSYLSVAEADAIAAQRIGPYADKWTAAIPATKEKALMTATRDVDEYIGATTRYAATQALAFPRSTDLDAALAPIIIPSVREATYEQAVYVMVNAQALADAATRRARALINFNEDNLGGSVALAPDFGRFSPDAGRILASIPGETRGTISSVPMRSILWMDSNGIPL